MKIIITDDSERENLIAEIWNKDKMIAEVNSEKEKLEIEFFDAKGLVLDLDELTELIEFIKKKLERP